MEIKLNDTLLGDEQLCAQYSVPFNQTNARLLKLMEEKIEETICSINKESQIKTDNIQNNYRKYFSILTRQLSCNKVFDINGMKRSFEPSPFIFNESPPVEKKHIEVRPTLLDVPEESKLEKVFTSLKIKRESIIAQNEKLKLDAIKATEENRVNSKRIFEEETEIYNDKKSKSVQKWENSEKSKKESIDIHNAELDNLYQKFILGDEESLVKLFNIILENSNYTCEIATSFELGYNHYTKTLVVKINVKNKVDVFSKCWIENNLHTDIKLVDDIISEFTIKTKNKEIKYTSQEKTELMLRVIIDICLATMDLIIKNDSASNIMSLAINIYHCDKCCLTSKALVSEFKKFDLTTTSDKDRFIEDNIKTSNQMGRAIKPIEELCANLN